MISDEIKQEINKLNRAEKLLLIEDVWDSIAQSNLELPMPEWQQRELDKRHREYIIEYPEMYQKRYSCFRGCPIR